MLLTCLICDSQDVENEEHFICVLLSIANYAMIYI